MIYYWSDACPLIGWLQLIGSAPGFPHGLIDPIEVSLLENFYKIH